MDSLGRLTLLAAVLAGDHMSGAVPGHVLTLAVATLHRLRAVANFVLALAAGADERIRTLIDVMTLLAAVATTHRTSVRALSGKVTLLLADAALARGTILGLRAITTVFVEGTSEGTSKIVATSIPTRHDEVRCDAFFSFVGKSGVNTISHLTNSKIWS